MLAFFPVFFCSFIGRMPAHERLCRECALGVIPFEGATGTIKNSSEHSIHWSYFISAEKNFIPTIILHAQEQVFLL